MRGYRVTHPGYTSILGYSVPSVPFRAKFSFIVLTLLILGPDIALAYGLYRLAIHIF